ncbi:hypothetical protein C2E23DRAFT_889036 [Lenzites betulinus]|nr:hypothetical protein C2E23DRAFT_889036 [Lenzites betulinus]
MSCTSSQVLDVARRTIEIFEEKGLKCCLIGSVASYLYGVKRTPNDVDLVVLTHIYGQEYLKEVLVRADAQYTLVRSRNPSATYRVLWYRIPGTFQRCKVDVLIPGILDIPDVPLARISTPSPHLLPAMPLIPQLLLKLQGWRDHRASHRTDMRLKQYTDVRDVNALLKIVQTRQLRVDDEDSKWVPETMIVDARSTLKIYKIATMGYVSDWKLIGLEIEEEEVALV